MRGCRLPLRKAWLLLLLWQRRVPFGVAVSVSGASAPTVRRWFGLFRANVPPDASQMAPGVEADGGGCGTAGRPTCRDLDGGFQPWVNEPWMLESPLAFLQYSLNSVLTACF